MKQIVITVIILLAISIHPSLSGACTSFAVYSDKTLYGMNFDYSPDVLQKFTISSSIQGKVFQMASRAPFGFADVAGMNIKGLFASCQMLFPEGKAPAARSTNQISTAVFHQMALSRFDKLPQVENFLNKRKVVHKEIYICLEENVHKIWKVSLEKQTIETHRGFASFKGRPIPAEGLLATELAQW